MPLTGYLHIPDIPGESQQAGHENEIDVFDIGWQIAQLRPASTGRGRVRARTDIGPLRMRKHYDAASPYLAQAVDRGKSFNEVVLTVSRYIGGMSHDYLTITLENAVLGAYGFAATEDGSPDDRLIDSFELTFEEMTISYTVQNSDGSSGGVHKVEINI